MAHVECVNAIGSTFGRSSEKERVVNSAAFDTICRRILERFGILASGERHHGKTFDKVFTDKLPRDARRDLIPSWKPGKNGVAFRQTVRRHKSRIGARLYAFKDWPRGLMVKMVGEECRDEDIGIAKDLHRPVSMSAITPAIRSSRDWVTRSSCVESGRGPLNTS